MTVTHFTGVLQHPPRHFCRQGHAITGANAKPHRSGRGGFPFRCRLCQQQMDRAYRARRRNSQHRSFLFDMRVAYDAGLDRSTYAIITGVTT